MTAPGHRSLGSREMFRGRRIAVRVERLADAAGREYVREVVEHPGAAVVLPVLADGRLVLVRQYRHAVGRFLLEAPAGTLSPGEEPEACARRELAEETGYRAGTLRPLAVVCPSPGVLTERLHLFLAEGLTAGPPEREPGEEMEVVVLPAGEVRGMARRGEIEDAKTLLCVLLAPGGER